MPQVNYYELLQVSPNASKEVIEAAYRRLARIYHPDHGGSTEQMAMLNEAYSVLSNPETRKKYDETFKRDAYSYSEIRYGKEGQEEVPIIRPWIRYFARLLDWVIWGTFLSFSLALIAPNLYYFIFYNRFIANAVVIFGWVPLEAFFIAQFRTTPGKWLLGTFVTNINNEKPSYKQAIRRSSLALLHGYALGVPIISIFFIWAAYSNLKIDGISSWDIHSGTIVTHKKIGFLKGMAAFSIVFIMTYLASA